MPDLRPRSALTACLLAGALGCGSSGSDGHAGEPPPVEGKLFTLLPSSYTGVRFENRLTETQEQNVFTYRNFYNGGGVALGDLTGDGRPEIVLTSNQGGARLYLNQGQFRFRDVTQEAGLRSKGWTTGVTLADVNGDGLLDLYLCHAGDLDAKLRANELYLNQGLSPDGVPTFLEQAAAYGIADSGYSVQAAFFDHDKDGDLDLFVINNSPRPVFAAGLENTREVRDPLGGDRLYRNQGGRFTDVSQQAGIYGGEIGLALGLGVSDVNRDGWPDVFVANDFFERDYLYVNLGDGTFAERLQPAMPYISLSSMGMDIADINNDGWPDLYVADMLPEDEYRLRTTTSFEDWGRLQEELRNDFHYQLTRNMLQLNNGDGTFSEVAQLAGTARTDWSWSPLIADFDLDGFKDIHVTNGLVKDVTLQDYIALLGRRETMRAATRGGAGRVDFLKLVNAMTATKLPNYAFHNRGDSTFANESAAWGLDTPSFSSGSAYGDLDGDGALDLVVNNVNQETFVYRNNARGLTRNSYLQVQLVGEGENRFGVGAKVTLQASGRQFFQELMPARGFQSSVEYVLTFGLGEIDTVASVTVEWPDRRVSRLGHVTANQRLTVHQREAAPPAPAAPPAAPSVFTDITDLVALPWVHRENAFVDFDREPLMPKLLSTEGPLMAVADVNRDGLDDLFIGGAKDQPGALLIQQPGGRFLSSSQKVFEPDRVSEDLGATFFDADGDGDPDLYVVSGGNEFSQMAPGLQDRLYLNQGRTFRQATGSLPVEDASGSRVVAADYDGDGDVDLFVGGRVVPWRYGADPRSMLLQNDGRGRFTDVTERLAPGLGRIGMVTDAVWTDVDGEGRLDLVLVGEWMPIVIFRNAGAARLERVNPPGLVTSNGWWNRIVVGDFNGDGQTDLVVGNLGLNTRFHATEREPVTMYVKDFDGNGFAEQLLSYYRNGIRYPLPLLDDLLKVFPTLQTRYPTHEAYARQTLEDVFSPSQLADAVVKRAYTFATALARQNRDGSFTLVPLPRQAQLAPVYGILASDMDRDGNLDLLLAGNFDGVKPEIGRMSASYGLLLRGDGKGGFQPVRTLESGFFVPGQARDIQRLRTAKGDLYVVTRNNDRPLIFRATAGKPSIAAGR